MLKTTRPGSAGSNCVIALWTAKAGRARNTPPTSSAVAHSSYVERQPGTGSSRQDRRACAPGQFGTASPKSAIWRVRANMRRPRSRNSQVSSEWKRTVARRGEPDPWCSTIIHASPFRSSFATKTLKPACASGLPA